MTPLYKMTPQVGDPPLHCVIYMFPLYDDPLYKMTPQVGDPPLHISNIYAPSI